ncbi:Snf7-domain-containing protein [Coniella lustricola]|uniref:Snf7-domain-containing protein n=1 Tax=Coniella lustricola TaxID=2025994 RepID=A0A2T3ABP1_9PEZI|nr:Snf7-domain-containing protein [Coniella lustricola]
MSKALEWLVEHEPSFRKARLPALYSDFRGQRTTNPDGFEANISAWKRGLASIAREGLAGTSNPNHVVLSADESLLRALESKQYGRPLALGTVIREAAQKQDLIPLQAFLSARNSIYYKSWASIPWNIAAWGFEQLGLTGAFTFGSDDHLPGGQFVIVVNLELAAMAVLEHGSALTSRFERTFSKAQFQTEIGAMLVEGQRLSDTDTEVLLKFMSRDKGILLYDGKTVKLKTPGVQENKITAEDETIASLKELAQYLEHQTMVLEKKIEELTNTAKEAVAKKNRVSALAALRSKKLAETSLQQRFATLNQLEEVGAKIAQAADNVQLVKLMDSSTGVLKDLNAQAGGAERVEEIVDHMREQMTQADEVSSILAEQGQVVNEGEIDDELEDMLQEKRREEEAVERAAREAEERRHAEDRVRRLAELDALRPNTELPIQDTEDLSGEISQMSLERVLER